MKILIVDDLSSLRVIMKNILKKLGYTDIEEANDGSDALFKLQKNFDSDSSKSDSKKLEYDLIISDVHMPSMSGIELAEIVKNDPFLKSIVFLLVTTDNTKSTILKAAKANIDGYIIKPFSLDSVRDKLIKMGFAPPALKKNDQSLDSDNNLDITEKNFKDINIKEWLNKINLEEYTDLFIQHDVDGESLLEINDEDLKEMGITSLGDRKKILGRIRRALT
ncbi:MAG: response regulator [Desulfobacterales bacterium]|nr:response regulator [Desulfobacterales bacterium]